MKPSTTVAIYFFLLAIFLMQPAFAQEDSKLSKYLPNYSTDDPSALYNGIPNISIPLYTLKGKGISVPVSISYDASGITVVQEATDVGLGWVLNGGGHIIQETRGFNDFAGIDRAKSSLDAEATEKVGGEWISEYDNIPDIFFFNSNGLSGKFMLTEDLSTGIPIPDQPIDISVNWSGSDWKFQITSDEGVKHYFNLSHSIDSLEFTVATSIFKLIAISTPQGDSINFSYNSIHYAKTIYSSVYDPLTQEYYRGTKSYNMPLNQLTAISIYNGDEIVIEYGNKRDDCASVSPNEVKMIDKIKLVDDQGDTIKYFDFDQGYFNSELFSQYLPYPKYQTSTFGNILPGEYKLKDSSGTYHTYDSITVDINITDQNTIHQIVDGSLVEIDDYYSRGAYIMIDSGSTTYALLNNDYLTHYLLPYDELEPFSYDSTTSPYPSYESALSAWEIDEMNHNRLYNDYMEANYSPTQYYANFLDNGIYYFSLDTAYMSALCDFVPEEGVDGFRPIYKSFNYSKRLKLNSITEVYLPSEDQSPPIVFDYNDTKLPCHFSSDIDHWGYYNYSDGALNLNPVPLSCGSVFSSCYDRPSWMGYAYYGIRKANEEKMKARILEKITYPYGGYIKYHFEANRARINSTGDSTEIVGGLRLKKIENGTGAGTNYYTTYDYREYNDTVINGTYYLDSTAIYSGYLYAKDVQYEIGVGWEYDMVFNEWEMLKGGVDNSVLSLSKTKSGYVGYSSVAVRKEDDSGNHLGTTLYRFLADTTHSSYFGISTSGGYSNNYNSFMAYISQPIPSSANAGLLKEKIIADKWDQILSRSTHTYCTTYPEDIRFNSTGNDRIEYDEFCHGYTLDNGGLGPYVCFIDPSNFGSGIDLICPSSDALSSVINTSFYPGVGSVSDSVYYVYDTEGSNTGLINSSMLDHCTDYLSTSSDYVEGLDAYYRNSPTSGFEYVPEHTDQLIQKLEFKNNGAEIRTRYWYPPHLEASDTNYEKMVERNIISSPVKIEIFHDTIRMEGQWTKYGVFSKEGSSNEDFILPAKKEQYFVDHYDPIQEFISYDDYASPREVKQENGNINSSFWRNRGKYQIASIQNAAYNEVIIQDFEEDTTGYGENWKIKDQFRTTQEYVSNRTHTGQKSLKLNSENSTSNSYVYASIDAADLDDNKKYTFSAWLSADTTETAGPEIILYYKTSSGSVLGDSMRYDASNKGNWQLLQAEIDLSQYTGVTGIEARVRFKGSNSVNCYCDDIRLFPSDALLTTYTYEPLIGKTSEIGPSGQTAIYEYDAAGRLYRVKDDDGNILKQNTYHFKE